VNKSEWSYVEIGSIQLPVAIMGMKTYLLFFVVSALLLKGVDFRKLHSKLSLKNVVRLMFLISVIGFIFSARLTYIEAYVLYTFCIFCLISQALILLIMIALGVASFKKNEA
jgi:uncharacterized membrane protein